MASPFSFGTQATPGDRYTRLLSTMPDTNNGTFAGGLANVIRGLLQGQMFRRGEQDQQQAEMAMAQGMSAQPWVNPDTGVADPKQAPVGGYAGGLTALRSIPGNEYAGRLASQLSLAKAQSDVDTQQKRELFLFEQALKPPTTRTFNKDGQSITQEYSPTDKSWKDLGSSPQFQPKEAPSDVQGYNFAKTPDGGSFKGTFEQWKQITQQGSQETLGNTPVWGTDAQGNPVVMQPSNRGGLRVAQMPPGVTPQRGQTSRVDLGTQWGVLDANGALIGYLPKDVAGEKAQGVIGTRAGEAQANAPGAVLKADQMLTAVDGILQDPNLGKSVGIWSLIGAVPNTPQYDFAQKAQQLQGQAFLQAFEGLKGGGQITETEGKKATDAIGRLSTAQSEKAYREALGELRGVLVAAKDRQQKLIPPSLNTPKPDSGFSIRRID